MTDFLQRRSALGCRTSIEIAQVVFAITNCPGSWNDSRIARDGGLYETLRGVSEQEYLLADAIFPSSSEAQLLMGGHKIRRPPKQNELMPESEAIFFRQLVAARQSAEWGIASLTRTFPRLTEVWRWDTDLGCDVGRRQVIETIIHLHNFRTRTLGENEIKSVWDTTFEATELE